MPQITTGYFDAKPVCLTENAVELLEENPAARQALDAFLSLTSTDRLRDTRHLYAYYRHIKETCGIAPFDDGRTMTVPKTPEAIWEHIAPEELSVECETKADGSPWYVIMAGSCDWELEHGLMMVWRADGTLCRVGMFECDYSDVAPRSGKPGSRIVYKDPFDGFSTLAED